MDDEIRPPLESIEEGLARSELDEARPALMWLAGLKLRIDEAELHGARRRALLLLATGGDPKRGLVPDSRAVTSLADDLWSERRGAELAEALAQLHAAASGLPRVQAMLEALGRDNELAWRSFACALLAEELAE